MELANSIKECDELSVKNGDIYFVFTSEYLYGDDITLKYKVTDISEFDHHPSRKPIYDSQSKEVSISRRYQKVYNVISALGFSPFNNIGEKYEQIFYREITIDGDVCPIHLRLQPNLLVKIDYFKNGEIVVYKGYFEYKRVCDSLSKSLDFDLTFSQIIRDFIIDDILS